MKFMANHSNKKMQNVQAVIVSERFSLAFYIIHFNLKKKIKKKIAKLQN